MYGLLLCGAKHALQAKYGEQLCFEIVNRAVCEKEYSNHVCYSEQQFMDLASAASDVTGDDVGDILEMIGEAFVGFLAQQGYDRMLRVLGRDFRHFLTGLDNLHDYLRFSFPSIQPPSFFVEIESPSGLVLHYRSQRRGLVRYAIGQIREVARSLYSTDVSVEVLDQTVRLNTTHAVMRLRFHNQLNPLTSPAQCCDVTPPRVDDVIMDATDFLDVFPFHVVFGESNLLVRSCGKTLDVVLPRVIGRTVCDVFHLHRPLVTFTAENVRRQGERDVMSS